MYQRVDIVLGDDCMALYRGGERIVTATRLTFGDVLEALSIPTDIWEGDIDVYTDPSKFPQSFKNVQVVGDIAPAKET